ncbi:hypothetical protein GIB67_039263 [Kingdonia uniflora]|uniref:DUF599 domain-containing protein n=1 Tax=Kingdonia uniflora TaxID=39325 RepID=A0A7J7MMB7_9MAGN|nr:hypothetical protein GIB67_039263 [Kingdonia uniflora]
MAGYHLILLYRIMRFPQTTAIGYENHNKREWVQRMMTQVEFKDRAIALTTIASNTTAATFLASLSIAMSSLLVALIGNSNSKISRSNLIYGDRSSTTISVKYISILSCFFLAFASFVQSARYLLHANFLISTPNSDIPVKYVQLDVIKGGNFWSLGLRCYYFAITLLLWIFGPISMFVTSVILVTLLNFLDANSCPLHQYESPNQGKQMLGGKVTTINREEYEVGRANNPHNDVNYCDASS